MIDDIYTPEQHSELRRRWHEYGCLKTDVDDDTAARLWRQMMMIELIYRAELEDDQEDDYGSNSNS